MPHVAGSPIVARVTGFDGRVDALERTKDLVAFLDFSRAFVVTTEGLSAISIVLIHTLAQAKRNVPWSTLLFQKPIGQRGRHDV